MCVTSAAQAEARALVETLDFLSTRSLQLESDTLVLIRAVTGADHFARDGEVLISVAKRKLTGFDDLSLAHSEMQNKMVRYLVKAHRDRRLAFVGCPNPLKPYGLFFVPIQTFCTRDCYLSDDQSFFSDKKRG